LQSQTNFMHNPIIQQTTVEIQDLIYTIRNTPVMLDFELATIYGVETKRLNEQVKRNQERFPESFMFQITDLEYEKIITEKSLRSQFATLENGNKNISNPELITEPLLEFFL